jgi:transposase-like protein
MLQKLRRAMVRPERDRITGMVEVDDAYGRGGLEEGRRGGRQRGSSKAIVVAAVEIRGRGSGRVRLGVVEDVFGNSLVGFVEGAVAPGSVVFTDAWRGYASLHKKGYDHRPKTQGAGANAPNLLPRAHRAFSNPSADGLTGAHHGVGRTQLPHYLNEFVFRFNRRHTPMAAFQTLLDLAGQHTPTTYKMLYGAEPTG